jgi:hypothetical protein
VATPEICLVTVDPTYNFQQIVWQKDTLSPHLSHYNIYMNDGSGIPALLGSRSYDSSSVYEDMVNDPNADSVTYYLTAVDTLGAESAFSAPHANMFLWVSDNGAGGVTCSWRHYWGKPVLSYECHRDTLTNDTWEMVFSGGSGMTEWDDLDMPSTPNMQYILITNWAGVCSTQKAVGDFNSSRSNRTQNIATPQSIKEAAFSINELYPNPVGNRLNLKGHQRFGQIESIGIYNNQGKLVKEFEVEVNMGDFYLEIEVDDLPPSNYMIVVNSTSGAYNQQFIKK